MFRNYFGSDDLIVHYDAINSSKIPTPFRKNAFEIYRRDALTKTKGCINNGFIRFKDALTIVLIYQ